MDRKDKRVLGVWGSSNHLIWVIGGTTWYRVRDGRSWAGSLCWWVAPSNVPNWWQTQTQIEITVGSAWEMHPWFDIMLSNIVNDNVMEMWSRQHDEIGMGREWHWSCCKERSHGMEDTRFQAFVGDTKDAYSPHDNYSRQKVIRIVLGGVHKRWVGVIIWHVCW